MGKNVPMSSDFLSKIKSIDSRSKHVRLSPIAELLCSKRNNRGRLYRVLSKNNEDEEFREKNKKNKIVKIITPERSSNISSGYKIKQRKSTPIASTKVKRFEAKENKNTHNNVKQYNKGKKMVKRRALGAKDLNLEFNLVQ